MAQAVLTVLLLIIFIAYAVLFAMWNPQVLEVTGFRFGMDPGPGWAAWVPIWALPLAGLAIGAIIMALVIAMPWASMRRTLEATRERLGVEQARSQERAKKVKALQERVAQLKARLQECMNEQGGVSRAATVEAAESVEDEAGEV